MPKVTLAADYKPFGEQVAFHQSQKRFKVIAAGNRGGKTKAGGAEFLWHIYEDLFAGKGKPPAGHGTTRSPRLLYWVCTPTHDLGQFPFEEIIRFTPPELLESVNQASRTIWLRGDIKIEFKSAERPERLVGASVRGMWIDEACRVKVEAWRGGLRARLADQEGWAIFTSSPLGGRESWVYKDFVSQDGIDPHVASFHWTTSQNPHIPQAEVEHAKATLPDAWFKRDWEASWDSFGGSIYPEFSDELHVTNENKLRFEFGIPRDRPLTSFFKRIIASIDWGFSAPGCLLVVGEYGEGKWVVLEESYGPNRLVVSGSSVTWLGECKRVTEKWGVRDFIGDPEDADAMFSIRNNGISIRAAKKQVYGGIRRVASAMHPRADGKPGLRVFDTCINTIRELRNYTYKSSRDGSSFLEEPADNQSDHACDALRYAAMELNLYDYLNQQRVSSTASHWG